VRIWSEGRRERPGGSALRAAPSFLLSGPGGARGARRSPLLPLLVLLPLFLLGTRAPAAPASVTNVRYWTAPDHTRVVVDLTGRVSFTTRQLTGPDRIAVALGKAAFKGSTRKISVGDGLLAAIRMNELSNGEVEVVLDLEGPARFQVFALAPVADKPNRVVIDVYREKKPEPSPPPREGAVRRIVIDPGHGGDDPGAKGQYALVEKEITLDLARRLARRINALPGYEAILTRDADYFVRLGERQKFARRKGGDVFVSLHANAARSKKANGFEVYFLSLSGATDKMARELADKENAADLIGGVPEEAEEEILSILFDYLQVEGMKRSEALAEEIWRAFQNGREMELRNVKQAGFAVLKSLEIPAVLVEVGFITNRSDAALIKKDEFRDRLAENIARGVERYFARADTEPEVVHVVERGETAYSIARRYHVDVDALLHRNNLGRDSVLEEGQRLRIP
jgi:N-acetylmuramoyl-L-alanine amidase